MCLAIPMKIAEIKGKKGFVTTGALKKTIDLSFLKDAKVGDYVIVHAGFAIQKIDEVEAKKTLELWNEISR